MNTTSPVCEPGVRSKNNGEEGGLTPHASRLTPGEGGASGERPFVSIVVPAYNEAAVVERNLTALCQYMAFLEGEYRWEVIVINDGSRDGTGELAEAFAKGRDNVRVFHHFVNFGLGQALRYAFKHCRGDYIVTLDMDLSYSPDHIATLLAKIRETRARVVIASPYMEGGRLSNVPYVRRVLSRWANRFLSWVAPGKFSTLTGMVRAYDRRFLQSLNLKSMGMEVNPEIIYKALLLRARIEKVPAHLNWGARKAEGGGRKSSMKVPWNTLFVLFWGYLFRPSVFFLIPGFALLLFAFYVNVWMFIHFFEQYQTLSQYDWFLDRASFAVIAAFQRFPHTFVLGGVALMLAVQLISLGIVVLQSKRYFEEIFHLGTTLYRLHQEREGTEHEPHHAR